MKKVFLLCASHNDLGLIRALKKLGYYIIVSGNVKGQPGEKWADEYICADYSDKDAMLRLAVAKKIDCVVSCCHDLGVYTASYIAEKLGLPGYDPYDTALILHNKDRFKAFALANGLQAVESTSFATAEDALMYVCRANYPLIVKPTDCCGGSGVTRLESRDGVERAIELAFGKSRAKRIVIEPFVQGTQHGFCTFLINRKVAAICSNDEHSIMNPFRVEIDTFPARNFDAVKDVLVAQIEKIAELLSLKDGIFHLQYIMDGEKPMIIEVMRRILGNMYHVPGNLLTGIDWEYWQARAQCGLPLDDFPRNVKQEGHFAYKKLMAPANGTIAGFDVPDQYRKHLLRAYYLKGSGYRVTSHLTEEIGFLFFMFASREEMYDVLVDKYVSDIVRIKKEKE